MLCRHFFANLFKNFSTFSHIYIYFCIRIFRNLFSGDLSTTESKTGVKRFGLKIFSEYIW